MSRAADNKTFSVLPGNRLETHRERVNKCFPPKTRKQKNFRHYNHWWTSCRRHLDDEDIIREKEMKSKLETE